MSLKMSARNMLKGKVEGVDVGAVMAKVKIKIEAPDVITAIITKESVEELDIKAGDVVVAIIKSTEVMVGKE
jgi:molybdopterin-binding protein